MKKKYNRVLGIDLGGSSRNSICLFDNTLNNIIAYDTISRNDSKTNLEHRLKIIKAIKEISNFGIDILIFESIRLFSYGHIQMQTILSLNKVQTTIINEFSDYFDIYQVDVRAWKSRVLGTAKADKNDSIRYVLNRFGDRIDLIDKIEKPRKHETVLELNHDLADSVCISTCLSKDYSILQEKNKMNFK